MTVSGSGATRQVASSLDRSFVTTRIPALSVSTIGGVVSAASEQATDVTIAAVVVRARASGFIEAVWDSQDGSIPAFCTAGDRGRVRRPVSASQPAACAPRSGLSGLQDLSVMDISDMDRSRTEGAP